LAPPTAQAPATSANNQSYFPHHLKFLFDFHFSLIHEKPTMKKISVLLFALVALLATSSCKQNTEPRYQDANKFELNTPAFAQQYYQLTPEGVIDLTWSQPDWGFSAAASYQVQVALNPDFTTPAVEGAEPFVTIDDKYSTCSASVSMEKVAIALCTLNNIKKEEQYVDFPAGKVYFRVVGSVPQVEGSEITSNVITLEKVKGYCAVQSPGKIYLVGAPEGWKGPDASAAEHYASWALYEADDAIGSKIYTGTFEITAGNAMFRFYTALTGWDADSYGSQADDNPIDYEFTDGEFLGNIVKGKGSYNFPNWEGGKMFITVDMNTMKVTIKALD